MRKRGLEDHLAVRLPRLYRRGAAAIWPTWERYADTAVGRALAVRLTCRSYDAFNRGDLDALHAMYHPECVWDLSRFTEWAMQETYRGYDGISQIYNDWWEPWAKMTIEPAHVRLIPGPPQARGVITLLMRGIGKGSGVETTLTLFKSRKSATA